MAGSDRRRGREWVARYLPLEVLGTVAALAADVDAAPPALTSAPRVAVLRAPILEGAVR